MYFKSEKFTNLNLILFLFLLALVFSSPVPGQKLHEFSPSQYYYTYDASHSPVLTLNPKDTLVTTTIDAFGNVISRSDQKASELVHLPEVNGQTGPFFVAGAEPGDVLVVHLEDIQPARDYAVSSHIPGFGALTGETYSAMLNEPLPEKTFIWQLDLEKQVGRLKLENSKLEGIEIPLDPFLGTIGVAPKFGEAVLSLTPAEHGGNMDCIETRKGTTLYFPVAVAGALLMLGDGHAAQGDGEICGTGLECPLKVRLTVDLIKNKPISWPRFEDKDYIMVAASTRPLMDAFRSAQVELISWLTQDYGFDRWEALQLVSHVGVTRVGNVVDPKYTVVAKFPKKYLPRN